MTKKTTKPADAIAAPTLELETTAPVDVQPIEPVQGEGPAPEAIEDTAGDANEIEAEDGEATLSAEDIAQQQGDQTGTQQTPIVPQDQTPAADQSGDRQEPNLPPTDPADPAVEPVQGNGLDLSRLSRIAAHVEKMMPFNRAELLAELIGTEGLVITRSIEGTVIDMAGITGRSNAIAGVGEHQAIENWANAARREILELEAEA